MRIIIYFIIYDVIIFVIIQGIAGLIMDFKRRKQPLCFYNPRISVLAVLQGVCVDEIVHCFTYDELEQTLNGNIQQA